jgi:hypothetical protein
VNYSTIKILCMLGLVLHVLPQNDFFFLLYCAFTYLIKQNTTNLMSLWLQNGMFTGPVLSVPLMLLSCYGMGSGSETIPFLIRIAMSFSYLRYGLEGIIVTMYGNDRQPLDCPIDYCHLREPVQLLRHVNITSVLLFYK